MALPSGQAPKKRTGFGWRTAVSMHGSICQYYSMPPAQFESKTVDKPRLLVRSVGRRARLGSRGCGGRRGRAATAGAGARRGGGGLRGGRGESGGRDGARLPQGTGGNPPAISPAPRILRGRRSGARTSLAPLPRGSRVGPGRRQRLPGAAERRGAVRATQGLRGPRPNLRGAALSAVPRDRASRRPPGTCPGLCP